jgi:hypothetical protein
MLSNPSSKEIARQHGAEEIEFLRQRVVLWKEDYFRQAPPAGGEDYLFLVNEFAQEIEDHLYLYVQRLRATDHLDEEQISELMSFCFQQVFALRHHILQGNNE